MIKYFENELYEAQKYSNNLDVISSVFSKTRVTGSELQHLFLLGLVPDHLESIVRHCRESHLSSDQLLDRGLISRRARFRNILRNNIVIMIMSLSFSTLGISSSLSLSADIKNEQILSGKLLKILALEDRKSVV